MEVSEEVRAAGTVVDADYASAFAIGVGSQARSSEEWARIVFEDAPMLVRWLVVLGWKAILRLRLGPRGSPEYVLGWKIHSIGCRCITLMVRSPLITAAKVVQVDDSRLVVATFVRFERRLARAVWSAVAPVHHRIEPLLLSLARSRHTGGDR